MKDKILAEISRRAKLLYDDQTASSILAEASTLEDRALEIFSESFSAETSVYQAHAGLRLRALAASGAMSSELATVADQKSVDSADYEKSLEYLSSREEFLNDLDLYKTESGRNPLDMDGKLSRMVDRGDSKSKIADYLNKNTYFQSQREYVDQESVIGDDEIELRIAIFRAKSLLESLENMIDPDSDPDFVAAAKDAVKPYDKDGSIAEIIDNGGLSSDVLYALKDVPEWNDAANDYLTRGDVEYPDGRAQMRWLRFKNTLNIVKDLDDR
jgi:hypothetical protein